MKKDDILGAAGFVILSTAGLCFCAMHPIARNKLIALAILGSLGVKFPKFGGVLVVVGVVGLYMQKI
ncbi:hypothetical protein [Campylobacter sputorum]|uniref:hypothetical protein n=1 Tax=Campylobacter sputorum TaxID=206 RepID=UPI000B782A5D|nr:hypothetical protein [Campylobacter sputorum]ASM37012.1 hypothetical protein CSF_1148 [Campylobacter sputorum bv. faecalis CCUG 20703]